MCSNANGKRCIKLNFKMRNSNDGQPLRFQRMQITPINNRHNGNEDQRSLNGGKSLYIKMDVQTQN